MTFSDAFWGFNAARVEFLRNELNLAATFLDVSETTRLGERRRENEQHARVAYECVLRFLPGTVLSPTEQENIDQQLRKLRDRFIKAGMEPVEGDVRPPVEEQGTDILRTNRSTVRTKDLLSK